MSTFTYSTRHATLEEFLSMKLLFEDETLQRVEVKLEDEVLIMSSDMFFAIFGGDAHQIYDKACESLQDSMEGFRNGN